MFPYHHCIPLSGVVFGRVLPKSEQADEFFLGAYKWLEKEIDYFPLFLAVGNTEEDVRMTGYKNQWVRLLARERGRKQYRAKGDFPNDVLFSFRHIEGVYTDYDYWYLVLNSNHKNYQITDYEKRLIFKYSWGVSQWLRKARREPHSVQIVVPSLDLTKADRIWVRNITTKELLERMGFRNIEVKRLRLGNEDRFL